MIDQEYHGLAILAMGRKDLIELVERAPAIDHVAHHFKVAEFHEGQNYGSGFRKESFRPFKIARRIDLDAHVVDNDHAKRNSILEIAQAFDLLG